MIMNDAFLYWLAPSKKPAEEVIDKVGEEVLQVLQVLHIKQFD